MKIKARFGGFYFAFLSACTIFAHKIHSMTRKDFEIMAPVGSRESLAAALKAGADSIYFGIENLNMRAHSASTFTLDDLKEIAQTCTAQGVKSYLTVNTIIYDGDLELMRTIIDAAKAAGISAVIASDVAVLTYARRIGQEVHLSTQLNISNVEALKFYAQFADVVVLARELNLEQVAAIHRQIEEQHICGPGGEAVRIEMFCHGALCMAVSGKCYLSLDNTGRSANRGECMQICRRAYRVKDRDSDVELEIDNQYIMSPKDLKTIRFIDRMMDAGVRVFKIEGRARGPEYVWKTVRAYRMLLDSPEDSAVEEEARQLLRSTATRRPSSGFFRREEWKTLIDSERPGVFGVRVDTVGKVSRSGLSVRTEGRLHLGDRLRLVPPDGGEGNTFSLISLRFRGADTVRVRAGVECFLPGEFAAAPGFLLYKIGENGFDFSRRASTLPAGRRAVTVTLRCSAVRWEGRIDGVEERWLASVDFAPARQRPLDAATVEAEFAAGVPEPWEAAPVHAEVEGAFFVPSSTCRELRRNFWEWAAARLAGRELHPEIPAALERFRVFRRNPPKPPESLPLEQDMAELRIPAFLPEGELPKWRERISQAYDTGVRRFRIGGIHGLELLRPFAGVEIIAEFPLPVTNSLAALLLREEGVCAAEPFAELDRRSLSALRTASPLPLLRCPGQVPLLVTRAVLPAGEWRDERGRRYRVEPGAESGVTLLFAVGKTPESVDGVEPFYSNEWK